MHPKKYSSSNCAGLVKAISGTTSLLQSKAYKHQRPYLAILATYMAIMAIEAADTWYVFSLQVRSLSHTRDLSCQKKLRFIRHTPQLSTSSSSSSAAPVAFSRLDVAWVGGDLVPNDAKPLSPKVWLLQQKQLQSLLSHLRICCLSALYIYAGSKG